MSFMYYIYFDKTGKPEKIVASSFLEFQDTLRMLVERTGEMPEWIMRVYR